MPRWLARVNKRVFNPWEIRKGKRPVLIHAGRSSGATYETPLDAHPIAGGYLFIPMYGPRTDWVKSVMAAGAARLRIAGRESALQRPRLERRDDVWHLVSASTKIPPGVSAESLLLLMDVTPEA